MSEVEYQVADGLAVLTMTRGAANALSPGMRADLADALRRAAEDNAVKAVVLTGAGGVFCSGVDLSEYDGTLADPWVDALARQIETHPKPIVAAMEGAALGAGFELALAAHARVARKTCRVALPEVRLGLMPSGGSTQRLPRLLGAQASLEFMVAGKSVVAGEPKLSRVFADLTDGAPLEAARAHAVRLAAEPGFVRIWEVDRGFSDPIAYQKAITALGGHMREEDGAERDILRCVEAAQLLPYEQGLRFEAAAFEARMTRPDARAARHLYAAERRASQWPEAEAGQIRQVDAVVLVGTDPVLAELAVYCLDRGQRVAFLAGAAGAEALAARVRGIYEGAVTRGRLKASARDDRLHRLSHGEDPTVLSTADLVLESRGRDWAEYAVKPGAVWCLVSGQAERAARQAQLGGAVSVLALRVYRPAHTRPLLEVAVPENAQADAVATVRQYFAGPGRSILRCADQPGLIGHRVIGAVQRAALTLLRAGVAPGVIEAEARALGFAKGPLEIIELEGIGGVVARLSRIFGTGPGLRLLEARADAVAEGETPGQGFYAPQGQALVPDPGLPAWLETWRAAQGDGPAFPDVPAQRALHAALVAEVARMLETGVLARASDVDLCMVKGYGFDRARGGPMLWADQEGVLGLVRAMKALEALDPAIWATPESLSEMVKFGRGFFDPDVS